MKRTKNSWFSHVVNNIAFIFALITLIVGFASNLYAQTLKVLYSFTGGVDGSQPTAPLVRDARGNFYGTTELGGANNFGAVFQITTGGTEKVLYSFTGSTDGGYPYAGLILDSQGNLYGTTLYGGATVCGTLGCGVIFKITPSGTETVLYSFTGGSDGYFPEGNLIRDGQGNLYGTTRFGGSPGNYGTVFKVSPSGIETVIYRFAGPPADGASPFAGLVRDAQGNLYGTTESGGKNNFGTAFELTSAGEKLLHTFTGGADASPWAGLIRDGQGNLYGTTVGNGAYGEVFAIAPSGTEKVLYTFTGGADGAYPQAALVRDAKGNLYGTTTQGGVSGDGTIFVVAPNGKETVLYNFTGGSDGSQPYAALIPDPKGNGYGTTFLGGTSGHGTVFELAP